MRRAGLSAERKRKQCRLKLGRKECRDSIAVSLFGKWLMLRRSTVRVVTKYKRQLTQTHSNWPLVVRKYMTFYGPLWQVGYITEKNYRFNLLYVQKLKKYILVFKFLRYHFAARIYCNTHTFYPGILVLFWPGNNQITFSLSQWPGWSPARIPSLRIPSLRMPIQQLNIRWWRARESAISSVQCSMLDQQYLG